MANREPFKLENLCVSWPKVDLAHIVLDMPNKSANVINEGLQDDLERAIDFLQNLEDVQGAILVSAKERIFVAGADLVSIVETLDWSDDQIRRFCYRGQRLYNRLQELPFLTVAAVRGACVGGGLELALGCSLVVACDHPKTLLGLPETKLGLIPGWAGTVRVPRLVGLERGIDLITSSRLFGSQAALDMGLIDAIATSDHLLDRAEAMIRDKDSIAAAEKRYQTMHNACEEQCARKRRPLGKRLMMGFIRLQRNPGTEHLG
ncbi:MAG: enoyl-CoA hydratase/isomerase family protein [Pirellulaceae bacterium]